LFIGIDATEAFEDIGHSEDARLMLKDYYLGELASSEAKKEAPKRDYSKTDKPSGSYSGKDNLSRSQWMYVLVPLALVVAFVAYRYM
jgi:cytochrome b involved in lipid metabolism